MRSKKVLLDQLVTDPLYKAAVMAGTEEDKKKIEGTLQPLLLDLMSTIEGFVERVKSDPEATAFLQRHLTGDKQVLTIEPHATGSMS